MYRGAFNVSGFRVMVAVLLAMTVATPAAPPTPETQQSAEPSTETKPEIRLPTIATGQMTDLTGAGQKDITVEAFLRNPDGTSGRLIAETKTDAMGDFTLVAHEPLEPQELLITFSRESFSPMTRVINYDESKPVFIGDSLSGNLSLSGKVVSAADQKPVIAHVIFENMFARHESETRDDGSFVFSELSPMQARLEVTAEGYGRELKGIRVPMAEPLVIELKPERRVTIRVVDEEGQPLSGVVLECLDEARNDFRTIITASDGSGTLEGLNFDTESLSLNITHTEFVASAPWDEKIELRDAPVTSTHQVVLRRAGSVVGEVLEADTGKPLYGARVFVGDAWNDAAPRNWTDGQGGFDIRAVPPGPAAVTVHMAGFAPELKLVDIVAGKPTRVNFNLASPRTVRGKVLNREGEPIGSVEVAATQWRGKQTLGLRAMTDRDGRFVFENAPTDAFEVMVFSGRSRTAQSITASDDREIELVVDSVKRPEPLKIGVPAPDFKLTTLDGQSVSNETLRDKAALVVFWATWCGPCLAEVPHLVEVHEKFRGRNDFRLIGVSRDFEESALRDFLKAKPKMSWPQAFGEKGGVDATAEAFGITGIPAIFLIDPKGRLSATDLRGEEILGAVEGLLKVENGP